MIACSIDGCVKPGRTRSLCDMHYWRLRKHGDPNIVTVMRIDGGFSAMDRFMAKVAKQDDGCWLWMGSTFADSPYGQFSANHRTTVRAHRWLYIQTKGDIADNLVLDHLCRVPLCVNPEHLQAVTQKVNNVRGFSPSSLNTRKTHCIHGHEFTPANTRISKVGKRTCRACNAAAQRAYKRKQAS